MGLFPPPCRAIGSFKASALGNTMSGTGYKGPPRHSPERRGPIVAMHMIRKEKSRERHVGRSRLVPPAMVENDGRRLAGVSLTNVGVPGAFRSTPQRSIGGITYVRYRTERRHSSPLC